MKKLLSNIALFTTVMIALFTSTITWAHPDHSLTGASHEAYHMIFWSLFALVAIKGALWLRKRAQNKSKAPTKHDK